MGDIIATNEDKKPKRKVGQRRRTKANGVQLSGLFENRMSLTVAEVAAATGMTEHAIRHRVARGQIPFRRFGQRVVFIPHEIATWLQNGAT